MSCRSSQRLRSSDGSAAAMPSASRTNAEAASRLSCRSPGGGELTRACQTPIDAGSSVGSTRAAAAAASRTSVRHSTSRSSRPPSTTSASRWRIRAERPAIAVSARPEVALSWASTSSSRSSAKLVVWARGPRGKGSRPIVPSKIRQTGRGIRIHTPPGRITKFSRATLRRRSGKAPSKEYRALNLSSIGTGVCFRGSKGNAWPVAA